MIDQSRASNQVSANGDACIVGLVQEYETVVKLVDGDDDEVGRTLADQMNRIDTQLAETSATGLAGIAAKARWLQRDENYNGGDLGEEHGNGRVLLSLLEDISKFSKSELGLVQDNEERESTLFEALSEHETALDRLGHLLRTAYVICDGPADKALQFSLLETAQSTWKDLDDNFKSLHKLAHREQLDI